MKILVSACLLGDPVRYDGGARSTGWIKKLAEDHELCKICPEVAGGLPVPREPAELRGTSLVILKQAGIARQKTGDENPPAGQVPINQMAMDQTVVQRADTEPEALLSSGEGKDFPGVYTRRGRDMSSPFLKGAFESLAFCRKHGIELAILKERSPSCGTSQVYDGTHSGRVIRGSGITATLLSQHGIRIFSEEDEIEVLEFLNTGEHSGKSSMPDRKIR